MRTAHSPNAIVPPPPPACVRPVPPRGRRAKGSSSLLPLHFSSGSPERHKGAWWMEEGGWLISSFLQPLSLSLDPEKTENCHPALEKALDITDGPETKVYSPNLARVSSPSLPQQSPILAAFLLSFCSARNMTSIFKEQSSISPLALAPPISPLSLVYQPFPHPRFHHRQQQTQRKLNNLSPASSSLQPLENESIPTASESNTRLQT